MNDFIVKDSGQRQEFSGGMVRDVADNKTWWSLVYDGPMLKRWATHLTKGAKKYAARNWMKAEGEAELDRARDSAARHFAQWMAGEVDEDHAAAVYFNINLAEYVKEKLASDAFDRAVAADHQARQQAQAPFPMTKADKQASRRLVPGELLVTDSLRGEFVEVEPGKWNWVPDNLRRWDRP